MKTNEPYINRSIEQISVKVNGSNLHDANSLDVLGDCELPVGGVLSHVPVGRAVANVSHVSVDFLSLLSRSPEIFFLRAMMLAP